MPAFIILTILSSFLLPSPNLVYHLPPIKVGVKKNISSSIRCSSSTWSDDDDKRDSPLSVLAASTELTAAHGVTISDIGGDQGCVVKMAHENGSSAKLMLPSGLITSYRPQMWHGGTTELLHTTVVPRGEDGCDAIVQGGLSLSLICDNDFGFSWSPNVWTFNRVKGNPEESIQVELISTSTAEGSIAEVKLVVTLEQDHLKSEILVSNSTTSSIRIMGSVISHLSVSTPDATYAMGLQGSDYYVRPPFVGDFTIIPPEFSKESDPDSMKSGEFSFNKLFSKWNSRNQNADYDVESSPKEDVEGEEDDDYKHLADKFSRIYTSTPRNFTIIDRGRRNSVSVRRDGFNEVYMLSPGSEHEWYSKYSYICIGHAALLEPIILNAHSTWRGGLQLWNPNS